MENYKVIADQDLLNNFIADFLPELEPGECYYVCLFARSKYTKNEQGENEIPHLKSDKSQLKRFTITRKSDLVIRLRQLEVKYGAYTTKTGEAVPQRSLAVYISPTPRSMRNAAITLGKKIFDLIQGGPGFNLHQEALSCIQKSKSKTRFIDFDIDTKDFNLFDVVSRVERVIGSEALQVLETRGGYHFMIEVSKVNSSLKNWHGAVTGVLQNYLDETSNPDAMIPVPGTSQGGFIPRLLSKENINLLSSNESN